MTRDIRLAPSELQPRLAKKPETIETERFERSISFFSRVSFHLSTKLSVSGTGIIIIIYFVARNCSLQYGEGHAIKKKKTFKFSSLATTSMSMGGSRGGDQGYDYLLGLELFRLGGSSFRYLDLSLDFFFFFLLFLKFKSILLSIPRDYLNPSTTAFACFAR